jgi:hypothetical protein
MSVKKNPLIISKGANDAEAAADERQPLIAPIWVETASNSEKNSEQVD